MKKRIIIHATNTPSDMSVTLNDIEDLNSQDMKSDPMPYHYIINIDGKILKGRPDRELCGHCGKFSRDSLSVAYAGGVTINDSDTMQHNGVETHGRASPMDTCDVETHCCASPSDLSSNNPAPIYEYENTFNKTQAAALRFLITQLTMRFPEAQVTKSSTSNICPINIAFSCIYYIFVVPLQRKFKSI